MGEAGWHPAAPRDSTADFVTPVLVSVEGLDLLLPVHALSGKTSDSTQHMNVVLVECRIRCIAASTRSDTAFSDQVGG